MLVRTLAAQGYGVAAVSRGEIALAARAGVVPGNTVLEGIGKTDADLVHAVAPGGRRHAAAVGQPRERRGRSRPGRTRARRRHAPRRAGTRQPSRRARNDVEGCAVGAPGSKFGVLARRAARGHHAGGGPRGPLRWRGIHLHVGSQLGAVDAWRSAFRVGPAIARAPARDAARVRHARCRRRLPRRRWTTPPTGRQSRLPNCSPTRQLAELEHLTPSARPRRLAVEPGRAIVAGSGWLLAQCAARSDVGHGPSSSSTPG